MSSDIPNKFTAKTDIGSFEVTISNRDYINIGAKNYCVQIAYNTQKNIANLDWLGTEKGGCELDGKEIHGDDTVIMTDLAFTILKQLYPNVNPNISLCDSSTFMCRLPNNNPVSISLMKYNLLLTGKTYYQRKFLAKLKYIESESAYNKFLENRNSYTFFDKNYDFNNNELNTILQPILQNSTNWGNFFENMNKMFGRNTCILMYSWYLNVYGFLAKEAIHSEWTIDLNTRPLIKYTITNKNKSKNYTRKSYIYNPYNFSGGYYPRFLSYKKFINNPNNSSNTLKSKNFLYKS